MSHVSRNLPAIALAAYALMQPLAVQAQAGGGLLFQQEPACWVDSNLTPLTVSVGLNGGVVTPNNGTGQVGSIRLVCNSFRASVSIGSNPMINKADINENERDRFANSIDFAGYARQRLTGDLGWRIASRPGVKRGSWQSNHVSTPIMNIDVFATNFETLTKMPVAGNYEGRICITVSPAGLPAPTKAQGTAGCAVGPS